MSKFPQINFDLNIIFLGFIDKAEDFIKNNLTRLPSDTSFILNDKVEIHLSKWMGADTSIIYRETFEEINYEDKIIVAAYLELENNNKKSKHFSWLKINDNENKYKNSRLNIDSKLGIYCIKEKT